MVVTGLEIPAIISASTGLYNAFKSSQSKPVSLPSLSQILANLFLTRHRPPATLPHTPQAAVAQITAPRLRQAGPSLLGCGQARGRDMLRLARLVGGSDDCEEEVLSAGCT